jgi:serine protease inhibitor
MPKRWNEFRWNEATLRACSAGLGMRIAELALPKLRLRSRQDLAAVMKKLDSNLVDSRLKQSMLASGEPVSVGTLLHEASVQINETFLRPEPSTQHSEKFLGPRLYLRFDRPFYFLLREPNSGLIVLMGQVTDPAAGG